MASSDDPAFTNRAVPAAAVPDYRRVEFEPVADSFRRYTLVSTALFGLLAVLGAVTSAVAGRAFPSSDLSLIPAAAAGAAVVILVIVAGYRWIDAGFRGWAVREHDLIARSGILWRHIIALPVARIQHVETTHGPLERVFGLARLKLYTAGGMTADLVVIGLGRGTADRLREYLVEQIRVRDERSGKDERD